MGERREGETDETEREPRGRSFVNAFVHAAERKETTAWTSERWRRREGPSSPGSKHNDSARQYVVAIGVIMWLLTSAIAVCYLLSYQHELPLIHLDHQGPVLQITGKLTLELVYYAVFGFLSLVAFFCAASHANGSGAAAASAFFSVVLTIGTIASCFITYRELSEEMSSSGPILNPGQPASVSQPAPGVTTQS